MARPGVGRGMKIIVGLGNPGKKYDGTRHNVGFEVLAKLAERLSADPVRAKFESLVTECRIAATRPGDGGGQGSSGSDSRLLLVWPQTFMNRSGLAARQATQFYKAEADQVLVVCDDLHLPVGKIRTRATGSAGGQNGLNDVIRQLGSEAVPRMRLGVGPMPDGANQIGFVLGRFAKAEQDFVAEMISRAADAALCWATEGIDATMNRYNG